MFAVTKLKSALMEAAAKVDSLTREKAAAQAEAEAAKTVTQRASKMVPAHAGASPGLTTDLTCIFFLWAPRLPGNLRSVQQLPEPHKGQQLRSMKTLWQPYTTR
jgi:hypothetical protein